MGEPGHRFRRIRSTQRLLDLPTRSVALGPISASDDSVEFPLNDDQLFVMGDNSAESSDARLWLSGDRQAATPAARTWIGGC